MRLTIGLWLVFAGLALADPADSEVRVRHKEEAGPLIDCGSGTVVWSEKGVSRVLTNHHVVPSNGQWIKVEHKGTAYPARRLAWDPSLDLACVEVDATLPVARVATTDPPKGTTVRQWGHPKASETAVHKTGSVTGFLAFGNGGQFYGRLLTTTPVESGDSGCGVFDAAGELVGVCRAAAEFPGGRQEQCVRLADVRRFLRLDE